MKKEVTKKEYFTHKRFIEELDRIEKLEKLRSSPGVPEEYMADDKILEELFVAEGDLSKISESPVSKLSKWVEEYDAATGYGKMEYMDFKVAEDWMDVKTQPAKKPESHYTFSFVDPYEGPYKGPIPYEPVGETIGRIRPKEIQEHFDAGWNILDAHVFQLVKHNFKKGQVKLKIPTQTTIEYTFLGVKNTSPDRHLFASYKDVVGREKTEYLDMEKYDIVYKYVNGGSVRKITASEMKSTLVRKPWQKTT